MLGKKQILINEYFNFSAWLIPFGLALLLILSSFSSFILFHTLAELFAIIIAVLMCVVAWQMYPFTKNNFLMYLGVGYFWIACLDLVHALSYKGLAIIPGSTVDTAIQIWIIARYFEALLLVSAPWFLSHDLNRKNIFVLFGIAVVSFTYLIVETNIFPVTFIEGQGLTSFKIVSEYIIISILIVAIFHLKKQEQLLDKNIVNVMVAAIALTMGAELAFTYYVDLYGLSNLVGHIFKLFSFWLIFMAMVQTTLKEPFLVMSKGASTYDVIPDATIVVDENGIIRQANNAACQISRLDCDQDEMVGKSNHDLFHPENTKMEHCPVCQAIVNNAELRGLELQVDDEGHWFDFSLSRVTGASHLNGTVEVIRDITQRKLAEDKVKELDILKNSIVENLPSMLFVKDAKNNQYVEWNKAAEELTGILKDNILGKDDFSFWPKDEAQFFIEKDKEVIKNKKLFDIPEEPLTTKYKGLRTLHTKKIPIFDGKGKAKYLLGISEDITDKLKTENMLHRSQKMDAVGQMSGGIAHDFNNQMGVILGYAELLSEQALTKEQLKWIEAVRDAAQRCADLTQQLLIFSRSGEVNKQVVNVNTLLSEMEVLIQRTVTPAVNVKYFMSDDLWETEVNPGECKDALLNLVLNARDAMPDGGSLLIETTNITLNEKSALTLPNISAGEYAQIMISDSGIGISEEVYEHVFEPFFTTKDFGKGTGLGLAMVYGFVHRYDGDILLESSVGEGATFRIYLPRSIEKNASETVVSFKDKVFPKGNESILVVDDEEALLIFAEQILKKWGYEVYCAKNAAEANIILEKSSIDLLFTDVVMPGNINGYELAEKALQKNSDLKILITSGYADKFGDNKEYAKYEFELISKPYNLGELAVKLRELLDI